MATTFTYLSPNNVMNGTQVMGAVHTTASAADTIDVPGISTIVSVSATPKTDPSADLTIVSATWSGNTITLKSWKPTAADNSAPTAATSFSKAINLVVIGY